MQSPRGSNNSFAREEITFDIDLDSNGSIIYLKTIYDQIL